MKTDTRLLRECSYKSVLSEGDAAELFSSFLGFKFIVHVLTASWNVLSLSQSTLENVYKSCENISFAIVRILLSKRCT